ncbi:MAG: hypothetical protein KGD65_09150 [Candidatus Lokiarchaeota archaeon]|nr:hypothetical protein [Candidatus Lokiarchaeota archaeon]
MTYTIAEGKFPKNPKYGNVLEVCRKDFRKIKDVEENNMDEFFYTRNVPFTQTAIDPKIINAQKENIESIRELIKEGREDVAFSLFFRTFPTCLPHRSNR